MIAADFEANPGGQNYPISGTTPITMNVWHHAAATYNGTSWSLYLDGNLETSSCPTTCSPGVTPRSDSIQKVALGAMIPSGGTPTAGRFQGMIDEARVWDHARTGPEILASENSELTSGTGLIARWGLNEGTGTTVGDSIATTPLPGANGTITGTGYSWVAPAANTAPVAVADAYSTAQDTAKVVAAPGVLRTTPMPKRSADRGAGHGCQSWQLALNANGGFTYTPTRGYGSRQLHLQGQRRHGRLEHGHRVADGDGGGGSLAAWLANEGAADAGRQFGLG